MKRSCIFLILLFGSQGNLDFARAEPEIRSCGGILHSDKYGLRFGGDRSKGEEEFICAIKKSESRKVLARCTVGKYCEVEGLADYCPDSGECIEISRVTSVSARPKR